MFQLQRIGYVGLAVLIVTLFGICQAVHVSNTEWDGYKAAFQKTYTPQEEAWARYYYAYNKQMIDNHNYYYNNSRRSYSLKPNQFTDLRLIQFNALFPKTTQPESPDASPLPPPPSVPTPSEFNPFVELGFKQNPRSQGVRCNSGWAYATATAVELFQAYLQGDVNSVSLSAQNLIDCAGSSLACTSQVPQTAFDYLTVHKRQLDLESYYMHRNESALPGMCLQNGQMAVGLGAYSRILDDDDDTMKTYVAANYPVVIEFNPTSFEFMHYAEGVFTPTRTNVGSHYMVVVGYGTENNKDYWLVQNSFDDTWGERGFMKIERSDAKPLAKSAILPIELSAFI